MNAQSQITAERTIENIKSVRNMLPSCDRVIEACLSDYVDFETEAHIEFMFVEETEDGLQICRLIGSTTQTDDIETPTFHSRTETLAMLFPGFDVTAIEELAMEVV